MELNPKKYSILLCKLLALKFCHIPQDHQVLSVMLSMMQAVSLSVVKNATIISLVLIIIFLRLLHRCVHVDQYPSVF